MTQQAVVFGFFGGSLGPAPGESVQKTVAIAEAATALLPSMSWQPRARLSASGAFFPAASGHPKPSDVRDPAPLNDMSPENANKHLLNGLPL